MGRPVSLTDNQDDTGAGVPTAMVQNVLYDFAGRLAYLQQFQGVDSNNASAYAQETRSYNANGQFATATGNASNANGANALAIEEIARRFPDTFCGTFGRSRLRSRTRARHC